MAQHTAGPWVIQKDGRRLRPYHIEGDGGLIAEVLPQMSYGKDLSEETKANAELIAAAPDMLAALKGLVDNPAFELSTPVVDGRFGPGKRQAAVSAWDSFVEAARSAIAKAEGRP